MVSPLAAGNQGDQPNGFVSHGFVSHVPKVTEQPSWPADDAD
jgi:hypothetical protein